MCLEQDERLLAGVVAHVRWHLPGHVLPDFEVDFLLVVAHGDLGELVDVRHQFDQVEVFQVVRGQLGLELLDGRVVDVVERADEAERFGVDLACFLVLLEAFAGLQLYQCSVDDPRQEFFQFVNIVIP